MLHVGMAMDRIEIPVRDRAESKMYPLEESKNQHVSRETRITQGDERQTRFPPQSLTSACIVLSIRMLRWESHEQRINATMATITNRLAVFMSVPYLNI
jgi:hypothetical protein